MKMKLFLSFVVAVAVFAGCYDMERDEKGRTVKINRITGEVFVIKGDKITKLKTEKDVKEDQETAKQLGEAKEWPAIPILKKYANAALKTKWGDGNIYIQLNVDRNLGNVANYNSELTIELYDYDSFLIRKIHVRASRMVVPVDSDGATYESMEYKEIMPMSENEYKKIKKWDIVWSGFNL